MRILRAAALETVSCHRCQRPYHVERTRSRQLPEVKLRRAPLVLGWVTAWEYGVLLAYTNFYLENAHLHFQKSMLKTYARS